MPVSRENSQLVYQGLKELGINFLTSLPETYLLHVIEEAEKDPDMVLVRLAREEEGVGLCAGAYFAGRRPVMLMQNHGLLASVNPILSLAHLYRIPFLMLISHRGDLGEFSPWQIEGGQATVPVLRALSVPHFLLDDSAKVKSTIKGAQLLAERGLRPVALLLTKELMWRDAPK